MVAVYEVRQTTGVIPLRGSSAEYIGRLRPEKVMRVFSYRRDAESLVKKLKRENPRFDYCVAYGEKRKSTQGFFHRKARR